MSGGRGESRGDLTQYYERLRQDASSPPSGRAPAPGLTILLHHGMTAWMQAVQFVLPRTDSAGLTAPSDATWSWPDQTRAQLITLVVNWMTQPKQLAQTPQESHS